MALVTRMKAKVTAGVLIAWICVGSTAAEAGSEVVVLDTTGVWRMHHTLQEPVIRMDDGLKPVSFVDPKGTRWHEGRRKTFRGILAPKTPSPPPGWTGLDADDGGWVRGPAPSGCRTPYLARLCLRGKFTVTDPGRVRGLTLSVGYYGGAIAYVNGKEIARRYAAKGKGTNAALAEAYPRDVYVDGADKLITVRGNAAVKSEDVRKRIARRRRTLDAKIPPSLLRKGLNVLAVELIRAPYHKVVDEQKIVLNNHGKFKKPDLSWNTCEVRHVQLTASSASGLVPNAVRPKGLQVWNADPMAMDFDLDFGDRAEPLRPIRLVGVRNGAFSGKVVVGSREPIQGLKATPSGLKGPEGTIPAEQVRVRYALPGRALRLVNKSNYDTTPYPAPVTPLTVLAEAPLAEFPVRRKDKSSIPKLEWWHRKSGLVNVYLETPGQPAPVFGAVVPVWVTVKVPGNARPGTYEGRVSIEVKGRKLADVPVELKVVDWTLPDPGDFRTWIELILSPETLVVEYKVPRWSDKHFTLMARSMRYAGEMGNQVLFAPLIAKSNVGNAESMVRWIRKGSGYAHDFSIMERYLDLALKHMGKPRVVVFNVWDRYLTRKGSGGRGFQVKRGLKVSAGGPMVTAVDPASGKTEQVALPPYTDPRSKGLWKPLFDELRRRMKKRGIERAMMLGMVSDFWATKGQATFLKEVSGNLPWANAGHYVRKSLWNGLAPFGYQSSYFGTRFGFTKSMHGWKRPDLIALFERVGLDGYPTTKWRTIAECAVTGNVCGVGRLGADSWPIPFKDKRGRVQWARIYQLFPGSDWGYLNANCSVLAKGPKGPVATHRFEALREGVQECEARIAIERALTDPDLRRRLGAALEKRCEEALAERHRALWRAQSAMQSGPRPGHDPMGWRGTVNATGHTWFVGSGWQARSGKLYMLAGKVAKKTGR